MIIWWSILGLGIEKYFFGNTPKSRFDGEPFMFGTLKRRMMMTTCWKRQWRSFSFLSGATSCLPLAKTKNTLMVWSQNRPCSFTKNVFFGGAAGARVGGFRPFQNPFFNLSWAKFFKISSPWAKFHPNSPKEFPTSKTSQVLDSWKISEIVFSYTLNYIPGTSGISL